MRKCSNKRINTRKKEQKNKKSTKTKLIRYKKQFFRQFQNNSTTLHSKWR